MKRTMRRIEEDRRHDGGHKFSIHPTIHTSIPGTTFAESNAVVGLSLLVPPVAAKSTRELVLLLSGPRTQREAAAAAAD